jgi:hypothetical protein
MESSLLRVNDFDPGRKSEGDPNAAKGRTHSGRIGLPSQTERCPNAVITMAGFSLSHSQPFVVGFTGHRRIENEKKISQVLHEVIASVQQDIGREMIGRSSIASGADTLFAEACLASNMKWIALLPFPETEFRKDFSETEWKRARAVLDRAERIETLSATAERPRGYLNCGLATVEDADLLVAVWDGKAPRGLGGTAQIVAHARAVPKPLILISPDGLEIKRERFSQKDEQYRK